MPFFTRLAAAAVVVVALAGGTYLAFRGNESPAGTSPSPAPASAGPQASAIDPIAAYRSARNAICEAAAALPPVPNEELWAFETVYNPDRSAEERAASIVVGEAIADRFEAVADQLDALSAPPEIAAEHIASVAHYRDFVVLLRGQLVYLADNRVAEAQALDSALAPVFEELAEFERRNALTPCF